MPAEPSRTSPVLLAAPLAFAVLTVFHPLSHPTDLDGAGRWLTVHVLQLVLSVPLAACVWAVLRGVPGAAARVARASVPVFLVAFAAFDGVAGLATGWLVRSADGQDAAGRAAVDDAVRVLFDDNWLTGNASVAGSVTSLAWLGVAVAGAVALRRAGADRLTVGLVAASVLFAVGHPPPFGTLGLLAFWAGAVRWERTRPRAAAMVVPVPGPREDHRSLPADRASSAAQAATTSGSDDVA